MTEEEQAAESAAFWAEDARLAKWGAFWLGSAVGALAVGALNLLLSLVAGVSS